MITNCVSVHYQILFSQRHAHNMNQMYPASFSCASAVADRVYDCEEAVGGKTGGGTEN